MQKLLYASLFGLALYTNSAFGMFKRSANSDQTDKRTALVVRQNEQPKQEPSKREEVDISVQLRAVLKIDNRSFFGPDRQEDDDEDYEEEDDDEEESHQDGRAALRTASIRKSLTASPAIVAIPLKNTSDDKHEMLESHDSQSPPTTKHVAIVSDDRAQEMEEECAVESPPARVVAVSNEYDDEDESHSNEQKEQAQQPYADRHTLGLKLEWLQKLPLDQIDVINFDPSLTAEEQTIKKQELIALLASTATAVNTNLNDDDFDTPRLIIDVSKLTGYAALIACTNVVQKDAGQATIEQSEQEPAQITCCQQEIQKEAQTALQQHSLPPPTQTTPQPEIIEQPHLLQTLGIPVATGILCFVLGYLFARQ